MFLRLTNLLLLLLLCGCSTAVSQRQQYLAAYTCGDVDQAQEASECLLSCHLPNQDYRDSGDSPWLLLDAATLALASEDANSSVDYYRQALEAADYYSQSLLTEQAGAILLQDDVQAYDTPPFEQTLARLYFALALLEAGDHSNARALLRQCEDYQQEHARSQLQPNITNAMAKLLLALIALEDGDSSNADILLREVELLTDFSWYPQPNTGYLLLVIHNGHVPVRVSSYSEATHASTVALEILLPDDFKTPNLSTLPAVPVPRLAWRNGLSLSPAIASVAGVKKITQPLYNVGLAAQEELKQRLPMITARAVARHLIRRAAVVATSQRDSAAGTALDFACLIANLATRADVRCWATLPERIDAAVFNISPGEHILTVCLPRYHQPPKMFTTQVSIEPNKLHLVQLFTSVDY